MDALAHEALAHERVFAAEAFLSCSLQFFFFVQALALAQSTAEAAQKNIAQGALAIQDAAMDPSQLAALAQSGAQGALTTAQGGMNAAKSSLKNITKKKIKRKKVQVRSKWVGWQAHDLPVVRD